MPRTDTSKTSHRWLLGVEPFFEGGWFHKGSRSRSWNIDGKLGAVSLLGGVVVDPTNPRTLPAKVDVQAYAIGRDVEVLVRPGTHVDLSGRANNDHLKSEVTNNTSTDADHVIRITGHTFLDDVSVRTIDAISITSHP